MNNATLMLLLVSLGAVSARKEVVDMTGIDRDKIFPHNPHKPELTHHNPIEVHNETEFWQEFERNNPSHYPEVAAM